MYNQSNGKHPVPVDHAFKDRHGWPIPIKNLCKKIDDTFYPNSDVELSTPSLTMVFLMF